MRHSVCRQHQEWLAVCTQPAGRPWLALLAGWLAGWLHCSPTASTAEPQAFEWPWHMWRSLCKCTVRCVGGSGTWLCSTASYEEWSRKWTPNYGEAYGVPTKLQQAKPALLSHLVQLSRRHWGSIDLQGHRPARPSTCKAGALVMAPCCPSASSMLPDRQWQAVLRCGALRCSAGALLLLLSSFQSGAGWQHMAESVSA